MAALFALEELLCPGCGSENPIEIVYGLPDPELVTDAGSSDVEDPLYRCRECSHEWGLLVIA